MAGVAVTVGGDFSKLDELDSKIRNTVKKATEGFQTRIGQKMFDGLLTTANRIPEMIGNAISAASDLNEVVSKTRVVFGTSSDQIMAWAANSATALGQSRAAALGAAADFGNLFRAMSIAPGTAAAMSQEMVELATDLASFNNTSTEEAIGAIGAALRGEAEPIRRYGVLLDEATLKAQALAMGLSNGKDALTPATKALAAHAAILAQTGTAQGDFARTSTGAANSVRIIKAVIADASSEFGGAFLPAVEGVAAKLKTVDFASLANGLAGAMKAAVSLVPAMLAVGISMAAMRLGAFVTGIGLKITAMRATAAAAQTEAAAVRTAAAAAAAKTTADTAQAGATAQKTVATRAYTHAELAASRAKRESIMASVGAAAASQTLGVATMGGMTMAARGMGVATTAARTLWAALGPIGWTILAVSVGVQILSSVLGKQKAATDAMEESFDRGNAALKKFNAETLRGEVTSRDDIAKKLAELEEEKAAILAAAVEQTKDMDSDSDLAQEVIEDTERTIKALDQQGRKLAATTDAQLEANAAKAAAARAEQEYAEAMKKSAEAFEAAKKSFDDALASREKDRFEALGLEAKIAELNKAEAKIRDGFNYAIKTNLGDASPEKLREEFAANPKRPGADKDMEAATELLNIDTQREKIQAQIDQGKAKEAAARAAITASYQQELAEINAQIDGNDKKLAQLQREAFIREKIAEMAKAGIDGDTAASRANALAAARDALAEKERRHPGLAAAEDAGRAARLSTGGKEAATGERIAELIGKGLTKGEATKTANLESLSARSDALKSRRDSAGNNQSIVTGSQGRIGGGGGVYVAGLDYQRQIAAIGREQLMVSKQIAAVLANNRIFD